MDSRIKCFCDYVVGELKHAGVITIQQRGGLLVFGEQQMAKCGSIKNERRHERKKDGKHSLDIRKTETRQVQE